nr:uncharacterized protein LOC113824534 isoform X2 [Penaeus vannamei]
MNAFRKKKVQGPADGFPVRLLQWYASLALASGACEGLAIDLDGSLRQSILEALTAQERHLLFGDLPDPTFYLATPGFSPLGQPSDSGAWRLVIRSPALSIDATVAPVDDLVAPHLVLGVYIDGEYVTLPGLATRCHFRSANSSYVVTVSTCEGDGVDGVIVTPRALAILHPLPRRIRHVLPLDENATEANGEDYGPHIFHVVSKEMLPRSRFRRDAESGETAESTQANCATGPEHELSESEGDRRTPRRAPLFRSISELTGHFDRQEDLDKFKAPQEEAVDDEGEDEEILQEVTRRKTVELAVFCDDVLYDNFPRRMRSKEASVMNYALTLVNAVQGIYHQEELQGYVIDLRLVRLDILTSSSGPSKSGGDIGAYLKTFCSWQKAQNPAGESNPRHWDHAFMLSGLDLHSSGNTGVIGLAWVSGMCKPSISCTMNEGRSFMAVYVVAHEMGHNLGMNHDGHSSAGSCNSNKYIMSPSVGPGKTTWSQCSVRVIHSFLKKSTCLDDGGRAALSSSTRTAENLLRRQDVPAMSAVLKRTPGHRFPLPRQCEAMFGRDYYPAITKFDLCNYMYCTNGIVTKPAHPALEGSICGQQRVCFAGRCRPEQDLIKHIILFGVNPTHVGGDPKPTTVKPPLTVPEGNATQNCTCDFTPQLPPSLHNLPKSICMFLAPVFHPTFNCSIPCPSHVLHVDLDVGNVTEEVLANSDFPADGSCYLGSYTVIQGKTAEDIRVPLRNSQVCGAVPHVMHPTLQCPSTGASGEEPCPPESIILILQNISYTYVHDRKSDGVKGQSLLWRGEQYTLLSRAGEDDLAAREAFASMIDTSENIGRFGFIKCNLQNGFPKELKNLPKDICNFLAPSLHDLFDCSPEPHCAKYVMFMDLDTGNTTKVPVKKPVELLPPCKKCPSEMAVAISTIWEIVKGVTAVLTQATGLCKLLPASWLPWIPGCSESASLESGFGKCPPVSIAITASGAVFVYRPSAANRDVAEGHPSLEWQDQHYTLDKISYDGNPADVLIENYDLDFRYQIVSQTQPGDFETALKVGRPPSTKEDQWGDGPAKVPTLHAQTTVGLQEYVAQKDVFLALNAPTAMTRTAVGACSVTCGRGVRPIVQECVDVHTEEVLDPSSCQVFSDVVTKFEECVMLPCGQVRYEIEDWGTCSKSCGMGVQYRRVTCVLMVEDEAQRDGLSDDARAVLVVADDECEGARPHHVRECEGTCLPALWCENKEDCFNYDDIEISKDFDY